MPTEFRTRGAIEKLINAGYPLPSDTTVHKLTDAWLDTLSDCSDMEVGWACRQYARSDETFWPKPGRIRRLILDERQPPSMAEPDYSDFDPADKLTREDIRALWADAGVNLPTGGALKRAQYREGWSEHGDD